MLAKIGGCQNVNSFIRKVFCDVNTVQCEEIKIDR